MSKRMMQSHPCAVEQKASYKCLEENVDRGKCQDNFDAYRECMRKAKEEAIAAKWAEQGGYFGLGEKRRPGEAAPNTTANSDTSKGK